MAVIAINPRLFYLETYRYDCSQVSVKVLFNYILIIRLFAQNVKPIKTSVLGHYFSC